MDKDEKFDRFIENFDKKLNTDTSTYKAILTRPASPSADTSSKSPQSPLLSTPTKARRNSISPADDPLLKENNNRTRAIEPSPKHMELRPAAHDLPTMRSPPLPTDSPGIKQVRLSGSTSSLRRSNTMSGISSVHRQPSIRRGLNLNLNLKRTSNTPTTTRQGTLRSPELVTPTQDQAKRLSSPSTDTKSQLQNTHTPVTQRIAPTAVSASSTYTPKAGNTVADPQRNRRNTNSSVISSEYSEVDDSLRTLAAKEMKVIELKHKLKMLQQELESEESELKKLRDKVGNSIYKGISPQHNQQRNSFNNASTTATNTPKNDRSKRESIWSKPVNFLNQFDALLQTEIERINKEGFKHSSDSSTSDKAKEEGGYSIWSFVNDVKHGLLGEDDSPTKEKSKQLKDIASDDENGSEEEMVTIRK